MGESPRNRFPRMGALPVGIAAEAHSLEPLTSLVSKQ